MGCLPSDNTSAHWPVGAMILVYAFVYNSTIGLVCCSLVSETPSTRLRAKTVVIVRVVSNAISIVNGIIILNKQALNCESKTGFFWASGGLRTAPQMKVCSANLEEEI